MSPRFIRVNGSAEPIEHPMAAGLVARGEAEWVLEDEKPKKRRKKTEDLSGAAREGQDADNAENEPPTLE